MSSAHPRTQVQLRAGSEPQPQPQPQSLSQPQPQTQPQTTQQQPQAQAQPQPPMCVLQLTCPCVGCLKKLSKLKEQITKKGFQVSNTKIDELIVEAAMFRNVPIAEIEKVLKEKQKLKEELKKVLGKKVTFVKFARLELPPTGSSPQNAASTSRAPTPQQNSGAGTPRDEPSQQPTVQTRALEPVASTESRNPSEAHRRQIQAQYQACNELPQIDYFREENPEGCTIQ